MVSNQANDTAGHKVAATVVRVEPTAPEHSALFPWNLHLLDSFPFVAAVYRDGALADVLVQAVTDKARVEELRGYALTAALRHGWRYVETDYDLADCGHCPDGLCVADRGVSA